MPCNGGSLGKEAMSCNERRLGPGEVLERGAGSWGTPNRWTRVLGESCLLFGQEEEGCILGKDEMVGVVCHRQVPEQEERWERGYGG